jgi:hypothetical protein
MKTSNLQEATLNEILFPVEKVENERNANPEYEYVVRANIEGEKKDLNYCSNRYELVPNENIFPVIRQILVQHNIEFTEKYYHLNHARFYSEYVIEDSRFAHKIGGSNGDVIKPMLRVQHSYNGLTKYMINFGYYRMVCSNGLVIPVEDMKQYNLYVTGKHTQSIKNSLEKLNETITYFAENAAQITTAITAKYDQLAGNMVTNVDDRIKEVLAVAKIAAKDNTKFNTVEYIKSRISDEIDLYGGRTNDWLIYNAINQYIHDDSLNVKVPEVRQDMDSKVFEYMTN